MPSELLPSSPGGCERRRAQTDRDRLNPKTSEVATLADLAAALEAPRVVCVIVPCGAPTEEMIIELPELLQAGDVVVDGGYSYYDYYWTSFERLWTLGGPLIKARVGGDR